MFPREKNRGGSFPAKTTKETFVREERFGSLQRGKIRGKGDFEKHQNFHLTFVEGRDCNYRRRTVCQKITQESHRGAIRKKLNPPKLQGAERVQRKGRQCVRDLLS